MDAGVLGALHNEGKRVYMTQFRSTMCAHHIMYSLNKDGKDALRVDKDKYKWFDDSTGEPIMSGIMLMHLGIQTLRPRVLLNVFNKISKIKKTIPANYGYDMSKWCTAMEKAHIQIDVNPPGAYHQNLYSMDVF